MGQGVRVLGRVVRVAGADSQPLGGAWVVLHGVTTSGGAPVDSARSSRDGRYAVQAPTFDSTALYVVSVMHQGIAYFTSPVHTFGRRVDTAEVLAVFDTSSVTPDIRVAQRHIVVRRAAPDGSRRVVELIVLANDGDRTRVAAGPERPVWRGTLPRGATQLEVGQSDVSGEAIVARGDTLLVTAPVPPGQKQVVVSYLLPASARALDLPVDQPLLRLNVLVEDSAARVAEGPLAAMGFEVMEGASFARFDGALAQGGGRVVVWFGRSGFAVIHWWWIIVLLAGGALAWALAATWAHGPAGVTTGDAAAVAAELAAIEAALAATDQPLQGAERSAYERRRSVLQRLASPRRD
jgi:hypothetical protein